MLSKTTFQSPLFNRLLGKESIELPLLYARMLGSKADAGAILIRVNEWSYLNGEQATDLLGLLVGLWRVANNHQSEIAPDFCSCRG